MRQKVAAALQAAGIAAGVAAGLTVSLGLGLAIAAVGLLAVGVAMELR
jgi:hypothetical protein